MAVKAAKKSKEPEDDELTGLDEELAQLEAATDLDDLDIDEPDDELEEDEEEPAPAKRKTASKAKAEDDDDEEDDLDDDDEEDGDTLPIADLDRSELKTYIKEQQLDVAVKKSMSDDDIRTAILEALAADKADDDDEEDDVEIEPPKKPRGRPKGSGSKPTRVKEPSDEPRFTPDDVAEIAQVPEHQVRDFARKHSKAFPKDSPKAHYRFNARQVRVLLRGLGTISK
jgi:hypothetical protein